MAANANIEQSNAVQRRKAMRVLRNQDAWANLTSAQRWEIVRRVLLYLIRSAD